MTTEPHLFPSGTRNNNSMHLSKVYLLLDEAWYSVLCMTYRVVKHLTTTYCLPDFWAM